MDHPYSKLPPQAYWRSGVADLSPLALGSIYTPKFTVKPDWKIAAAGSCFAQHIGHQFKQRGFNFLDLEPPPPGLSDADKRGSPVAIIEGGDEKEKGVVQIKDLILGAKLAADASLEEWKDHPSQYEVPRGDLVAKVREILDLHK